SHHHQTDLSASQLFALGADCQSYAKSNGRKVINQVCFSPDGQWVASASFDNSVKLWNGTTGKFVATFRHVRDVYQISWSADSRLLLSGSKDSTLKVSIVSIFFH
ncbi:notchless protein, partial [Trifolium pratense]